MNKTFLKLVYFILNGLVLSVIIVLDILQKNYGYPYSLPNNWLQPILVISSVLFALIIPMWMRIAAFNRYVKKKTAASMRNFFRFELFSIISGWVAFVITPWAYIYAMNIWARYLITFMALYSLYYTFPWERKLIHDSRLFNIKL